MKIRLLVWVLLSAIIILTSSGCASVDLPGADTDGTTAEENVSDITTDSGPEDTTEAETDNPVIDYPFTDYYYYRVYSEILNNIHEILLNIESIENENFYGDFGGYACFDCVVSAVSGMNSIEALKSVGYVVSDISGDEIPELLIVRNDSPVESDEAVYSGSEILAAFTCVGNVPQQILEGYARSCYCYIENGKFFYEGSGGISYSIFGLYEISHDGSTLECKDYYFCVYEPDKSGETDTIKYSYYHNTLGVMDEAVSEKLDITDEQFGNLADDLRSKKQKITLNLFYDYIPAAQISAHWADDVLDGLSEYDVFIADSSETSEKIVLSTNKTVGDFKLVSLYPEYFYDDGTLVFYAVDMYSYGTLTPEHPLVAGLTFYGDVPNCGISYTDADGLEKVFALEISGEDGSLMISTIRYTCG